MWFLLCHLFAYRASSGSPFATFGHNFGSKWLPKCPIWNHFGLLFRPECLPWNNIFSTCDHLCAKRSLKWCPKAHFEGFGVPRYPPKLHFYDTDAQNWSQGLHFEGFGPQFAYSSVFLVCFCATFFCFYSLRLSFFCPAMLSLQPPSTSIRSKSRHH